MSGALVKTSFAALSGILKYCGVPTSTPYYSGFARPASGAFPGPSFKTLMLVFAVAYSFLGAHTAMATPGMTAVAEAFKTLELWDVPGALKQIDAVLKEDPGNTDAVYVKARALFYEGDYGAARDLLRGWETGGLFPEDHGLQSLVEDTAAVAGGLKAYHGDHFIIYASADEDWVLVDGALKTLDESYRSLGLIFGMYPERPVRVEIIPDAGDFQKVSSLSQQDIENSKAIGICKFNKIMVLSPRLLARGYRWTDTLAHEYIHYLLVRLTGNNAPVWVQEGIAKYFEKCWKSGSPGSSWLTGEAILSRAIKEERLIPFESMDPSLVKLNSPWEVTLAFAECMTAVEFIISKSGFDGLLSFLENISNMGYGSTRKALRQAIGLDFEEFERAWKDFLSDMELANIENLHIEGYKLAGDHDADNDLFASIRSQTARNHLNIGDALRKKGRIKPAMIEYKRADRENPGSPYILDKIAITAGLLEDYRTLIEYAEKSREIAPDYPLTYMIMGDACLRQGRFEEAIRWYDEYNEINPFNPELYFNKGAAFYRAGRTGEALASWEISLKLNPSDGSLRERIDAARKNLPTSGG